MRFGLLVWGFLALAWLVDTGSIEKANRLRVVTLLHFAVLRCGVLNIEDRMWL